MYYKIENKDSEVYRKLYEMRTKELKMSKDNLSKVKEQTGLDFSEFVGNSGQQNYWRTTQYHGFKFIDPEKVDQKVWKKDKEYPEYWVPNTRTKAGKKMQMFLLNELESSWVYTPIDILGLPHLHKFTMPYVEIAGDLILMHLDDHYDIKDPDIIEITRTEFMDTMDRLLNNKKP